MKLDLNALHNIYNRTITRTSKHHQAKETDYKNRKILNQQVNKYLLRGGITTDQAINLISKYVDLLSIPNESTRNDKKSVLEDKAKSQNPATILLNLALYSKFGLLDNFIEIQINDELTNIPTGIYYPLNHYAHQHGFELQTYRMLEPLIDDYNQLNPDNIQNDDELARYYSFNTLEENYEKRQIDEDDVIIVQTKVIPHSNLKAFSINGLKDRLDGYDEHLLSISEAQRLVYLINHLTTKQIKKLSLNKKLRS